MTQTPFEQHPRTTTWEEEEAFWALLAANNPSRLAVDVVGQSVLGKPIRLIRVGATAAPARGVASPSSCLWVGLQHGGEVQSREALMAWARDMAETNDPQWLAYLAAHPVLIMPTCNPDNIAGSVNPFNANGVNLNRDHFALTQPETIAIHTVMRTYDPQLVHDMHTGGATDMDLQGASAYEVDTVLRDLSYDLRDTVISSLAAAGISSGVYPAETSATLSEPRMLRDAGGILNRVALLSEVRSSTGNPATDPTFVMQHGWCLTTIRGVALWHQNNAEACAQAIAGAKARALDDGKMAGARPFSLGNSGLVSGVKVLPVPPGEYWLRPDKYALLREKLRLLGISAVRNSEWWVVSRAQEASRVIPYVLDPASSDAKIPGVPIGAPLPAGARVNQLALRIGARDHPVRLISVAVGGALRPVWARL